ncbi:MAG: hypothetical protein H6998_20620 [Hahellaceae bacterium]|jgi:hypothetical protein|nr:hypothetical protein [Hahellaceae bacterium]
MKLTARFKPHTQSFTVSNEYSLIGTIEIRQENGEVVAQQVASRAVFEEVKRIIALYEKSEGFSSGPQLSRHIKMSKEARMIFGLN